MISAIKINLLWYLNPYPLSRHLRLSTYIQNRLFSTPMLKGKNYEGPGEPECRARDVLTIVAQGEKGKLLPA
eukprot:6486746-Amphidinium_carterae.2